MRHKTEACQYSHLGISEFLAFEKIHGDSLKIPALALTALVLSCNNFCFTT